MSTLSLFARFLSADRKNMHTPERLEASLRSGVSARPILNEVPVEEDAGPFLVTDSSSRFVSTLRSGARGIARCGFSDVPLEQEAGLLSELYMALLNASWSHQWGNRCNSVAEAMVRMRSLSMEPAHVILGENFVSDTGDPAQPNPGVRALQAELASGAALVTATPALVGLYTRVGDYVGVMIQRADRAIMVVGDDVA